MKQGTITGISGPVIDVRFPEGSLPAINEAIAKMQSENKLADFITAANELSGKAVDVTADDSAA